ncbi:MAG: hypothetical protein MOGMAGMI_00549 [Candidatus Omnitrophica bacterium]|nr:hypothetical protein [Candidatus Omnitrophota bacterium]
MKRSLVPFSALLLVVTLVPGCATARARKAADSEYQNQLSSLQNELQSKDQQIQDLQYQLEQVQRANYDTTGGSSSTSSVIRVSGVDVKDVQRALARAGFNPGPVDGRLGKKTKAAIKAFQRRNNLKADGIVGERTWSLLK